MKLFMYVIGRIHGTMKTLLASVFVVVELVLCAMAFLYVCYDQGIEGTSEDKTKILNRGWRKVVADFKGKPDKKIVKEDGVYTVK